MSEDDRYNSLWSLVSEMGKKRSSSPSDVAKLRAEALKCRPGDEGLVAFVLTVVQGLRDGVISGNEKDQFIKLSLERVGDMKWTLEQGMKLAGFIFGIFFLLILVVISLLLPNPSPFQYMVLRTLLALAGAAFALALTGAFAVRITGQLPLGQKLAVYGTATFAVFIVLYLINPAQMMIEKAH